MTWSWLVHIGCCDAGGRCLATKATADHVAIKRALATGHHAVGHPQAAATSTTPDLLASV